LAKPEQYYKIPTDEELKINHNNMFDDDKDPAAEEEMDTEGEKAAGTEPSENAEDESM
jgi:hypothetical protein